jgi:serine/threonine-protein kinase RsbW
MTAPTAPRGLDHTHLSVAAGPLVGPVLARVIAIHASRSDLPIDRVSDALLIADALAARAPAQIENGRIAVSVQSMPGRLEIRVGPLRAGGAERLLAGAALPEGERVVERLADDVQTRETSGGEEVLVLRVGAA